MPTLAEPAPGGDRSRSLLCVECDRDRAEPIEQQMQVTGRLGALPGLHDDAGLGEGCCPDLEVAGVPSHDAQQRFGVGLADHDTGDRRGVQHHRHAGSPRSS